MAAKIASRHFFTLLLSSLAIGEIGFSQSDAADSWLANKIQSSSHIFVGEVIDVSWEKSDPSASEGSQPLTFVTFRIDESLMGEFEGDTITVKSIGGISGSRLMLNAEQAYFNLGQQEIIFADSIDGTPLPIGHDKRIRIFNDTLYDSDGMQISENKKGEVVKSKIKANDIEFYRFRIGSLTLTQGDSVGPGADLDPEEKIKANKEKVKEKIKNLISSEKVKKASLKLKVGKKDKTPLETKAEKSKS